jgi:hypothetical protein
MLALESDVKDESVWSQPRFVAQAIVLLLHLLVDRAGAVIGSRAKQAIVDAEQAVISKLQQLCDEDFWQTRKKVVKVIIAKSGQHPAAVCASVIEILRGAQ